MKRVIELEKQLVGLVVPIERASQRQLVVATLHQAVGVIGGCRLRLASRVFHGCSERTEQVHTTERFD